MRFVSLIRGSSIVMLVVVLVTFGCKFDEIVQPTTAVAGSTIEVVLTISNDTAESTNPWKGLLGILMPEDWDFVSGTYDIGTIGSGTMDTVGAAGWVDSLTANLDPAVGYKWVATHSDTGYLYPANTIYETTIQIQVGDTAGDFTLGYLVTQETMDMIGVYDADSLGNAITLTPNATPVITSAATDSATEGEYFKYLATATDVESDTITLTFENLPAWLNSTADSAFGTPTAGATDTSFLVIASDRISSDSLLVTLKVGQIVGISERRMAGTPEAFGLKQNYPNPFNPATKIVYDVPEQADVRLTVYDLTGKEVAVLAEGLKSAGQYEVTFAGGQLPTGIYFYRLAAGSFTETRKMLFLK